MSKKKQKRAATATTTATATIPASETSTTTAATTKEKIEPDGKLGKRNKEHHQRSSRKRRHQQKRRRRPRHFSKIILWSLSCLIVGISFIQIYQGYQVVTDTSKEKNGLQQNLQKKEQKKKNKKMQQKHQNDDVKYNHDIEETKKVESNQDMKESNDEDLLYGIPPPPEDEYIPLRNDNNSTFSACLLVMDDNHYLIEWLAYHYHVLPLRYLVITVDPRSKTTPDEILNRWERRQNNIDSNVDDKYDDSMMTIVKWNDSRFLPYEWQRRQVPENDPIGKLAKHRERQRHFYPSCFEFLKKAQRSWTMVIDVDEFARVNPHYINYNHNGNNNNNNNKQTTVLQTIHDNSDLYHHNISCITMPRLRFGNFENETNPTIIPTEPRRMESNSSSTLYDGFVSRDFLTLRWKWRAGLHSRSTNRHPKSMINLQRITNFSRQDTDAHRPVRSECPRGNLYILNRQSPFSIHHYVGTVEQFSFREDAREGLETRSKERLEVYNSIKQDFDDTISGWINEFVQEVGPNTSKELLMGIGNVSYSVLKKKT